MPNAEPEKPTPEAAPADVPAEAPKDIGKLAREQYAIPIDDESLGELGDDAVATLREWAAGLYPQFADKIKAGIPPRVLLSPYVALASRELGRQVDLGEPLMQEAAIGSQMNTLDDFRKYIREQDEWDEGPVASKLSAQLARKLNEGNV